MTTAGHNATIKFCATFGGTYVAADGIDSCDLNNEIDLLEITSFADGTYKKRIAGLTDWTLNVSGHFNVDATGQGLLRSLPLAGSDIFFEFTFDGTNGYGAKTSGGGGLVKSFKMSAEIGGTVKFSASIMGKNQALADVGTPD